MAEKNILIENAVILNRNFEGREEKPYNPKGRRNFSVRLNEELAHILLDDGWNVKLRESSDPDEESIGYLSVSVSYNNPKFIPKIIQITHDDRGRAKKTPLNENTIANIDTSEIQDIKLEIRPYKWEVNGNHGVKAYLKTMYFTLVKDPFEDSYGDFDGDYSLPFED